MIQISVCASPGGSAAFQCHCSQRAELTSAPFSSAKQVVGSWKTSVWMLAGSALFYGLGYGVFSVASELRYYLWTMMATAMATVIALGDFPALPPAERWRAALEMAVPTLVVLLPATLARL